MNTGQRQFRSSFNGHMAPTPQFVRTSLSGFGPGQRPNPYPIVRSPRVVNKNLTQMPTNQPMRGLSPYITRQGIQPPSYEHRFLQRNVQSYTAGNQFHNSLSEVQFGRPNNTKTVNQSYEGSFLDREKSLIARNESEIIEEQKKREEIRTSYEREIDQLTKTLLRNQQQKQKLLSEIETLQQTHDEHHQQLMSQKAPSIPSHIYEPLDRKQHEIIQVKASLVSKMREKEQELQQEQEEEDKNWEQQLAYKEKILFSLEEQIKNKKIELASQKLGVEKPDYISLEEEVREMKYQDYIFEEEQILKSINRLTEEREKLLRDVRETFMLKKPIIEGLQGKHEQLTREITVARLKIEDLRRVGEEMKISNSNLQKELERKDSLIATYELDIHALKTKKAMQESTMGTLFQEARADNDNELILGLETEIQRTQEELRFEQSNSARLKGNSQRLYELLCSAVSCSIHQTHNAVVV